MTSPTTDPTAGKTYLELEAMAKLITERMHELRETGLERLHDELETKANDLGYSLAELIAIAKKKKRRTRAHKDDNGTSAHAE
jgi:hypothetical protein